VTSSLVWHFDTVPLKGGLGQRNNDEADVVHHLDPGQGIFEHSLEASAEDSNIVKKQFDNPTLSENEPPYAVFTIFMDSLADASVHLKIWEDKTFKTKERVKKTTQLLDVLQREPIEK